LVRQMVLVTKTKEAFCLLCLVSIVVGLRTLHEDHTKGFQEKNNHLNNLGKSGMDLTCSEVRSSFEEHGLMEDQKEGKCDFMYDDDTSFVIESESVCAEEISSAVTKFCRELPHWDLVNRVLYGKQLRCTDGAWNTIALQSIPGSKTVNDIQVRTTDEDWNFLKVKESQVPIVQWLNIVTMKFNIDMAGPEDEGFECVAPDSAEKWGISPEMQAQRKTESCKAWHMQQENKAKEVSAPTTSATAAYNLCRLFSKDEFHMTNSEYGDNELYFRCAWHPKNTFRLLACIGGICKQSMKYVHEELGEGGFFNMSLSAEDEEFLGPQWYLWGDIAVGDDTTTLKSDGLTVKQFHKTTPKKFSLKTADAGSIATVEYSPADFQKNRDALNQQIQKPEEGDRLWNQRCPQLNTHWQEHPCAYEMAMWIADFCTTFSHEFPMEQTDSTSPEGKLKLQCVTYGGTSRTWTSVKLVSLPEIKAVGEQSRQGVGAIFQYVDLTSQTLNMPVAFETGFDSCMNVSLPKRKAVHWRSDEKKLVFQAA